MQTKIAIALALSLCAGCASDLWYKKGAGTEALAQDKATCRAEVAQLTGTRAREAFEQCMSARDWFHVASAGRRSAPAPKPRSAARPVATPAAATPHRQTAVVMDTGPAVESPAVSSPAPAKLDTDAASAPTPESDTAAALPSVASAPNASDFAEDEPAEAELDETAFAPEPIDPKTRQFWVKFGAGPTQLQADQKRCRRELGVPDSETQPSRWGQSDAFDACMRARGWGGGSIQATP